MDDFYTIRLPVSRSLGLVSPKLVEQRSPAAERKHVERLAYYFRREFHYDFVPFEASESPDSSWYVRYEAWLFHQEAADQVRDVDDNPRRVIGAACFRQHEDDPGRSWSLQWIWFHPYERRRGHLSTCWQAFEQRYPQFEIEGPLSDAMTQFAAKVRARG